MTQERERRGVFGEAATQYEAARPGYPAQLVADVIAFAGDGPYVEVGAGTGKATTAFAATGAAITCVEPDARMAEVLAGKVAEHPGVSVQVSTFESWIADRPYRLLFCAQAWHWVDPDRRWDLAYAVLAPRGAVALFWNAFGVADPTLHAELSEVDDKCGVNGGHAPHTVLAEELTRELGEDDQQDWEFKRVADDSRFTDLQLRRYYGELAYSTAGYLDLLTSISAYRILEPDRREVALAGIAAVLDGRGGGITLTLATDLTLVRRA